MKIKRFRALALAGMDPKYRLRPVCLGCSGNLEGWGVDWEIGPTHLRIACVKEAFRQQKQYEEYLNQFSDPW